MVRRLVTVALQFGVALGVLLPAAPAMVRANVAAPSPAAQTAAPAPVFSGFNEDVPISGLTPATVVRFASNGHVFVAEKRGVILEFDSLSDTTPSTWVDLRTEVYNFWDRGLLGMVLDPNFPATPRIYVSYTHDAAIGGTAPLWGTPNTDNDPCPNPPGANVDGCVASGRVSVLSKGGGGAVTEKVLVEDWCQQFPSHSMSDLAFGPDGMLYVGGGDGASFTFADYGQQGDPPNPCGDPPGTAGTALSLPTSQGGSLRSQSVRGTASPVSLDGSIIRIDPATGDGVSGNPMFASSDPNRRRIIAYGLRNPFRLTFRPGTSELWVGDVGQETAEEVNRIVDTTPTTAVNFGWPCREGFTAGPPTFASATLCSTPAPTWRDPYYDYLHSECPGDPTCDSSLLGGSSISGLAFAGTGFFPPAFDHALFFADYSRNSIWFMPAGSNGLPDPTKVQLFAGAYKPVALTFGPDGALYFVDYAGSIRRIRYNGPVAHLMATPTSGPIPLQVQFNGSTSTGSQTPLTYAWDLNGDGLYDDSTAAAPTHTYTSGGSITARLKVTDANGATSTDSILISAANMAPVPTISTPSASTTWAVGQVIPYGGAATDAEDGTEPAARFHWTLYMEHCPSGCHEHTIQSWDGVKSGTFVAPDHEYPSHLKLSLTVIDSGGRSTTVSREIYPKTVTITLKTQPTGLTVGLNEASGTGALSATVIVGSANSITAGAPQLLNGLTYTFASWSDGGALSHEVVAGTSSATYTATYAAVFSDIASTPFGREIEWAAKNGITTGCGGGRYCPTDPVTREQMASFIVRALGLTAGATPDRFDDIAASIHRANINRLATAAITSGCGGGHFCPNQVVTRGQMAAFLGRALELSAGGTPDRFNDIAGSIFRVDINRLAAAGVTSGCGGGAYCPADVVTREQMAAFLYRAFH